MTLFSSQFVSDAPKWPKIVTAGYQWRLGAERSS